MNDHQATGHMRALLSAQHLLVQSLLRAKNRDLEAAKKLATSAFNEMRLVKIALNQIQTKKEIGAALIQLFYDDLDRQRIEVVEKEILLQTKRDSAGSLLEHPVTTRTGIRR